jgi:hypothetical protein
MSGAGISMGYYTNYAFVTGRFGAEFLSNILADQIPDGTTDALIETVLSVYVEAEIVKIDAQIDAACVRQIAVPVATTNSSFGMLQGIAEALVMRKIASHTQHDDIPSKIENEFISAMRQLGQLARGELVIAQPGQVGPSADGDSVVISDPETTPFHIDMETSW